MKTTSNQNLYKRNANSQNFVWDSISATHLLKRTITGCSFEEINYCLNQGFEESVNQILANQELPDPPGNWVSEDLPNWNALSSEQREEIMVLENRMRTLQKWWAQRMIFILILILQR